MTKDAKEEVKAQKPLNVYQCIAKVQAELAKEGISKDRNNQQQGYKFRGIDDIYNALSGLLAVNGLCILPRVVKREVTERNTKSGGVLFYVVIDMEYDFISAEDGSKHTIVVCGEAMDSGDKATNKAMSAAYKYACLQTFCIPTEGDNDADSTTHQVQASYIDTDKAVEIDLLIAEVKADKAKFVQFMGTDDVRRIRSGDYQKALAALNKKKAGAA